mmetsp:Transcript_14515/g.24759  ORF Transcript_14515/g.24759 Transcript_14515/m.24759 type:complete len:240 (+) Transcript_14515:959-1678(+)
MSLVSPSCAFIRSPASSVAPSTSNFRRFVALLTRTEGVSKFISNTPGVIGVGAAAGVAGVSAGTRPSFSGSGLISGISKSIASNSGPAMLTSSGAPNPTPAPSSAMRRDTSAVSKSAARRGTSGVGISLAPASSQSSLSGTANCSSGSREIASKNDGKAGSFIVIASLFETNWSYAGATSMMTSGTKRISKSSRFSGRVTAANENVASAGRSTTPGLNAALILTMASLQSVKRYFTFRE